MHVSTSTGPSIPPGEIANWPLLKVVYRTDPDKIADLLPPGIEPGAEPHVHVNIYNVPVKGEPEYGVSTKVDADLRRHARATTASASGSTRSRRSSSARSSTASRSSRARSCTSAATTSSRRAARTRATRSSSSTVRSPVSSTTRQATTRRTTGGSSRRVPSVASRRATTSRRTSCASRRESTDVRKEIVDGDARAARQPVGPVHRAAADARAGVGAPRVVGVQKSREITLAGPLDPIAFWPYADTIGGSRWPGDRGGPRFKH